MITKFLTLIGFDKAIFYSILARGWQLIIAPLSIIFIVKFFEPVQQGFYYLFNSIIALQLFFEMGLSFVIAQYTSHAFASLKWEHAGAVAGLHETVNNFHVFIIKSARWYLIACLLFVSIILPAGYEFLQHKSAANLNFSWKIPFTFLVVAAAMNLFLSPFFSILEGSGQVAEANKIRWLQNLVGSTLGLITLAMGGGLFMAAINLLTAFVIGIIWLSLKKPALFLNALKHCLSVTPSFLTKTFSWRQEIWPMQWKIALSWMSGYFISQLYVPILFYYHGPIVSGQLGLALSIGNILGIITMTWLNAKMPMLGKLAAEKNWRNFDTVFFRIFKQSLIVLTIAITLCLLTLAGLQYYPAAKRIITLPQMTLLLLNTGLAHIIGCFAQYLRAHKQEPFVWLSVVGALLMTGVVLLAGKDYATSGVLAGSLLVNLVYGVPSALLLWHKLRIKWHLKTFDRV